MVLSMHRRPGHSLLSLHHSMCAKLTKLFWMLWWVIGFMNDTVSWPILLIFSQKRISSDFEWISNIVIKTVTQFQSNYFWLTSSLKSVIKCLSSYWISRTIYLSRNRYYLYQFPASFIPWKIPTDKICWNFQYCY